MGLSTHILDTSLGKPAAGIEILLEKQRGAEWRPLARGTTDSDGRCKTLINEHEMEAAIYRLRFFTSPYFMAQQVTALYPHIDITFEVQDPGLHYHIPLLLAANGYTTYRGS
ncbi:MAG TPA: hydroxyisourate hydrolase [Acidobacteriaceae bacterium]|jgi:5-hydroxyisourate hydrolase